MQKLKSHLTAIRRRRKEMKDGRESRYMINGRVFAVSWISRGGGGNSPANPKNMTAAICVCNRRL